MQEGMLDGCQGAHLHRCLPASAMLLHCCLTIDRGWTQLYRLQTTWLRCRCHELEQAELVCTCAAATPVHL